MAQSGLSLPPASRLPTLPPVFTVTEAEAAAIRTAFEQGGELSAAAELRRLFPGITDNVEAQACARTTPHGSRCRSPYGA